MGYLMRKEQAFMARVERLNTEQCAHCPHVRGWHNVDAIPPRLAVENGEIVVLEDGRFDTVSCQVDGCVCVSPKESW